MEDNKSPGVDGIHPNLLMETVKQISIPLARVFNLSLKNVVVPFEWKEANIIPYDLSYEEPLTECGLSTLETRRLRGDQIEVFQILNGYENIYRNMFFSLKKDSRTRGHE